VSRVRRRRLAGGSAYLVIGVYLVAVALPVIWMVLASFKTRAQVSELPPKIFFDPTLDNYREVFRDSDFPRYLMNSAIVAAVSTVVAVGLGFLAAYAFVRLRRKRNDGLLFWILSMRMVPPLAVLVPFFSMMSTFGLYDTRQGLALVYITFNLPIAVWLLLGYLDKIPVSIEEAAMTDGCSRLEAIRSVVMPLAAPGLFATAVICLLLSWNEFAFALNLTGENAKTLPVFLTAWDTQRGVNWGPMTASALMVVLPVIVLAAIFQKWLVRGLTFGATK
jgi:ABC-type glycerol-3-phosphate transport system permease component